MSLTRTLEMGGSILGGRRTIIHCPPFSILRAEVFKGWYHLGTY